MAAQKLPIANFKQSVQATRRWSVSTVDGAPFDDLLRPGYWTHVAAKLTPGDIIEVHAVDGSYYAELYVRSTSKLEALVAVLAKYEFTTAESIVAPGYATKWRGPARRWGVVRIDDGSVVRDGFQTEDLAAGFLLDYRRSMAA